MLIDNATFDSMMWQKVRQYAENQINILCRRLATSSTWDDALRLQGQIKALENLIALELDKENESA